MPVTPKDPAMSGVIPYVAVEGVAAAAEFYKKAFDAEELTRMPAEDGKHFVHCHLKINGGGLMLTDARPDQGYPFKEGSFHLQLVYEDGIDEAFNQAVAAGCEVVTPLQTMFWGDRYGMVKDPFQITWGMNCPNKPA